jgi:glycosyltransferase involved in cell wall biosynthesis
MLQQLPIIAMQFVGLVVALSVVSTILMANIYDIQNSRQHAPADAAKSHKRRLLVSIVVLSDNQSGSFLQTIESIRRNGYRKIEIIIADNASGNHIRQELTAYKRQHVKLALRTFVKRKKVQPQRIIAEAVSRYGNGDYILWLRAGDALMPGAIKQLVSKLEQRMSVDIVRPRVIINRQHMLGGTLKSYQLILDDTLCKALSVMRGGFGIGERGMVRREVMSLRPRFYSSDFAYDVTVLDNSDWQVMRFYVANMNRAKLYIHSLVMLLVALRLKRKDQNRIRHLIQLPAALLSLIAALILPLILCYFIYLAIYLVQPVFLAVSIGAIVVIFLYCIWGEYSLPLPTRLRLSLGIPVTFIAYFLLSFIPIVAVVTGNLTTN